MTEVSRTPDVARFGRAARELWMLDPAITYLNHGTVGATPRRVLAFQQKIRDEIERNPSLFLLRELAEVAVGDVPPPAPRMRTAAAAVAEFVGARGPDLVFVDNATTGANAVLRSLELARDDEILVSDFGYGAVVYAATYVARRCGARVRCVEMPYPIPSAGAIADAFVNAIGPRTRLVITDHVTSESAVILPVQEIVARCHAKGVSVLVDGAHAPGAIALDVPSIGADWYSANLHKWAFSPRSCGFLWAAPARHAELHPPVISWGLDQGWTYEFDWVGTRDPSPMLSAPEGIAMQRDLGVERLREHNHALAWEAARLLAGHWKTELGMPESMVGTMATIPLPERMGTTRDHALAIRNRLLFEDHIEVQMHAWRSRLWVRISAQIYNELEEYERLAERMLAKA